MALFSKRLVYVGRKCYRLEYVFSYVNFVTESSKPGNPNITTSTTTNSEQQRPKTGVNDNKPTSSIDTSSSNISSNVDGGGSVTGTGSYFIPIGYVTNYLASLFASSKSAPGAVVAAKGLATKKRKPQISRDALRERTRGLVGKLRTANTGVSQLLRTEELCRHLLLFPESRSIVLKEGVAPLLWRWRRASQDQALIGQIAECLALLGQVPSVDGRGIRLLSIDGGGTRGLMALEILDTLEQMCPGYRISQLFDYIIGVSTGALIAAMIGGLQLSIPQCKKIYKEISVKLFDQGRVAGSLGLLRSHSYYDTEQWVVTLRQAMGEKALIETARNPHCPRLGIVSCVVNRAVLEPFVFRNYHHHPDSLSIYPGSAKYKLWQALQASAAAPGYFEECKLDMFIHQDGGVVVNNPTAVGIHECKALWPDTPLHCVLSIGTGKTSFLPQEPSTVPEFSSTKEKLVKIICSATETEKVHTTLNDILPPETYYRLNPYMSYAYGLDEIDPIRLQQITQDARIYIRKNYVKLQDVAKHLRQPKTPHQRLKDWWRHVLTYYS